MIGFKETHYRPRFLNNQSRQPSSQPSSQTSIQQPSVQPSRTPSAEDRHNAKHLTNCPKYKFLPWPNTGIRIKKVRRPVRRCFSGLYIGSIRKKQGYLDRGRMELVRHRALLNALLLASGNLLFLICCCCCCCCWRILI